MTIKENYGANPVSLNQGYQVLNDRSGERFRDNQVPASANLVETDNGGFLGRTESKVSESSKL